MLFIVLFFLMISSLATVFFRRDKQSKLMLGLCASFICMYAGIMIYLAKTGGIVGSQTFFLYFDREIQRKLSYMIFPLHRLGYMIAVGRTLFPGFFLMIALNYSMIPQIVHRKKYHIAAMIIPGITVILYYPRLFLNLSEIWKGCQTLVINITIFWIILYIAIGMLLLIHEYRSITIPYCKRQFRYIIVFLISVCVMYCMYFRQDPIQVYQMYSAEYMRIGGLLYSGTASGSMRQWVTISTITTLFGIFGFLSLRNYSIMEYEEERGDIVMQRKIDIASKGISIFVHGIKNQLLSNKILNEKLHQELCKDTPDQEKLKEYSDMLTDINNKMLGRMEELYRSIKSNTITLSPTEVRTLADKVVSRFHDKYPDGDIKIIVNTNSLILADESHLSEAINNLVINGYEAILEAGRKEPELIIKCYDERLYVTIEVSDNGKGMSRQTQKKIFDPFYTSKNTNSNWGMGLYYVRQVVKNHLGMLKIESTEGKGTSFFIEIPKYEYRESEGEK